MTEQIKQIAERLRGLRDSLNLSQKEFAALCEIDETLYAQYESGNSDISISILHNVSIHTGIDLTSLLSGDDPHISSYAITRKGQGINIERRAAYRYQSLSATFQHRRTDPFIVTVEPKEGDTPPSFNTHEGQEFNYILEGELKLFLGSKEIILQQGDSIYFNPKTPHAMQAMNNTACKFLACIIS